jgi:hypothetical protein
MNDPMIAHTQYGDYKGGASADKADDKNIMELAQLLKVPKSFWPIGFDFLVSDSSTSEAEVSIYAVDAAEYGSGIDSINQKASAKGGALPVIRFSRRISLSELFSFFKRFHVTAFNKALKSKPFVIES